MIASEWKNIVTSSEVKINIVKNKKKNKTTGNRSKSKNTIRNIDKVNIKRYDKNIQKYLGRRKKFNISTTEEREVQVKSIFYKTKSYLKQNQRNNIKRTMRKRKITSKKNTYIQCSKKHPPPSKEKIWFVPRIKAAN